MQILINQTEIERAIIDYMHKRINIAAGSSIQIEMKATRGSEGYTAMVDILDEDHAEIVAQEKERVTKEKEGKLDDAGRFLEGLTSKEKPKESTEDATSVDKADARKEGEASASEKQEPATKARVKSPESIFKNAVTKA